VTTEAQIIDEVAVLADAESWPELSYDDLVRAVVVARRADVAGNPPDNVIGVAGWVTATAYTAGTVIVEGERYWRCVVAGTSGATEPSWPDLTGTTRSTTELTDGDVVWQDNGTVWAGDWDVAFAAAQAWQIKAGKVASAHNFGTDGQIFSRAQVHRHCLEQVRHYRNQRLFVA
jgi:hypothetical protein